MLRLRKEVYFLIIILVIFASIYYANKRSGLIRSFSPQKMSYDTTFADKIFDKSENKRKILMQFHVNNSKEISNAINDIIFKEGVTTKYSDTKSNFQLHILEIPKTESEKIVKNLRKVETLNKENIQSTPFTAFEANVEENIKNNTITKNRIQAMINRTTSPQSMTNFHHQLDMVQTKIDSLNNLKMIQDHNANFDLIYVSAILNVLSENTLSKAVKKFFINLVIMLIIMTFLLVIIYFFFVGLTKLLRVLGIKTSRGSSSNYNYNYGYSRGKKKIKRKYVSQEEADKKKAEEEEE